MAAMTAGFRSPWLRMLLLGLLLLLVAAGLLWTARIRLAEAFVQAFLENRAIVARYRIDELTFDGVLLSEVSVGSVARPDFQAARIAVRRSGRWWRPEIGRIVLERPVLRATIGADGASFGALDALIPASTGEPLPAIDVRIGNGRLLLDTPWGALGAVGGGTGNLRDGFRGALRVAPAALRLAECGLRTGDATLRLATTADAVRIAAEGVMPEIGCGADMVGREITFAARARGDPALARWDGDMRIAARDARTDDMLVSGPEIALHFAGGGAHWQGGWSAAAGGARWAAGTLGGLRLVGDFTAEGAAGRFSGRVKADDVDVRLVDADSVPAYGAIWAENARRALRRFAVAAPLNGQWGEAGLALHVPMITAEAASGARLLFGDGDGLRLVDGAVRVDGRMELAGGGLPVAHLDLVLADGRQRVGGDIRYSGAMGGGLRVDGMALGFAVANDAVAGLAPDCATLRWQMARQGDFQLGPGRISACPDGDVRVRDGEISGALHVEPIRLAGRMAAAGTVFAADIGAMRLRVDGGAYALAPVAVRLDAGGMEIAARVGAAMRGGRVTGTLADMAFSGAQLPVRGDSGGGAWAWADGQLRLTDGVLGVVDVAARPRFQPLAVSGIAAHLRDGCIRVEGLAGLASQPAAGRVPLLRFDAEHALEDGRGGVRLDTGELRFDHHLQPWQISELVRGVLENVRGTVTGKGEMRWEGESISATGQVGFTDVAVATALGPVDGINGEIVFSDLLALRSPPGQEITVAAINPGILIENGRLRFQLAGGGRLRVEAARWPFFGGTLAMRPVEFDPAATTRHFVFDAEGVDAGLFLQGFDLKDVNATGIFDGTFPLEFADGRARIADGVLTARMPGGLLQYVGDVGADEMGAAGKLAFDALRRLRYRAMTLKLNGDLDGELVSDIHLDGVNENPVGTGGGLVAAGMPFRFNISVRAPFRHLLGTAASFGDARALIRSASEDEAAKKDARSVQPR